MPALSSALAHVVHEVDPAHREGREVDAHREPRPAGKLAPEAVQPGERFAQHPALHLVDHPRLLGDRDEVEGRDQPAGGVLPAHQRLAALHPPRLHVDDGLELDTQLRGLERMEEVGAQLHAGERRRVHLGLEEHVAILAVRLGPIHGHVGIAQQVAGPEFRASGEGHPDAGARHHPLPLHHERGLEGAEQAPGQSDRGGGTAGVLHQDRELVAAQPAGEVAPAQAAADPVTDLDQQLVPRGVAEAVVDRLETIDVEIEEGEAVGVAAVAARGVLETLDEEGATGEPGQPVLVGELHRLDGAGVGEGEAGVLCEGLERLALHRPVAAFRAERPHHQFADRPALLVDRRRHGARQPELREPLRLLRRPGAAVGDHDFIALDRLADEPRPDRQAVDPGPDGIGEAHPRHQHRGVRVSRIDDAQRGDAVAQQLGGARGDGVEDLGQGGSMRDRALDP